MKTRHIYIASIIVLSLLFTIPNLNYFILDVRALKQDLPIEANTAQIENPETVTLPSFLQSSTGVNVAHESGLTGSGDPTTPLMYTTNLTNTALENDLDIYGINLTENAKKAILEQIKQNSALDSNISNNMTAHTTSGNTSVNILVVQTLQEFCNYK